MAMAFDGQAIPAKLWQDLATSRYGNPGPFGEVDGYYAVQVGEDLPGCTPRYVTAWWCNGWSLIGAEDAARITRWVKL